MWKAAKIITQILRGKTLINTELGHSVLIYLSLINVACKFHNANLYSHLKMALNCVKIRKNESKLTAKINMY